MAQPTDESKTSILPESDLNPLQNPLLGAHMGRWAEVYFTTPPEKRAQAVSDLVRELSNNSMAERISSSSLRNDHGRDDDKPIWGRVEEARRPISNDIFEQPVVERPLIGCESCGHKNVPQQRFCGMCGAPVASPSEALPFMNSEPISSSTWEKSEATLGNSQERQAGETTPDAEIHTEHYAENYRLPESRPWPASEQGPAEFSVLSDYQSEPVHHSYRIYVGLIVAILLGLLVYMTWRSNTAFWSSGTAPSELPRAVPAPSSEAPVAAEPSTATRTPAAATARPAPKTSGPATAPRASAVESQNPTGGTQEKNQTADRRAAERRAKQQPAPRAGFATTGSVTDEQNGSEELAAAEKYLNAGPGTARDSRQAATWLWKAVAKQNLTATLLLSDLYLRGDGVTKSCDQAHLLLDAAARKGASAAGERLRNLQAFGCR
ncbi:MAG TPA: zinc ribbon domain-containing protein [Candidatus Acidoferrales bacterium]|nr:zinc ribbon domain-containing protein [Candidatus Acidoferrales bacterium]